MPQEPTREEREAVRGTLAERIGSRLALEVRAGLPLFDNFAPTGGLLIGDASGLYAGIVAGGARIGGVSWFDPSRLVLRGSCEPAVTVMARAGRAASAKASMGAGYRS